MRAHTSIGMMLALASHALHPYPDVPPARLPTPPGRRDANDKSRQLKRRAQRAARRRSRR